MDTTLSTHKMTLLYRNMRTYNENIQAKSHHYYTTRLYFFSSRVINQWNNLQLLHLVLGKISKFNRIVIVNTIEYGVMLHDNIAY